MTNFSTSQGISWSSQGIGPEVILLRGLGRWSDHWGDFPKLMSSWARVTLVDNRGFGLSKNAKLTWDLSIEQMANDVAEVINQAQIKDATLVGVSLGGMIAMELASKYPNSISKLVLVNSSIGSSPYSRISAQAISAMSKTLYSIKSAYPAIAKVLLSPGASHQLQNSLADSWLKIDQEYNLKITSILKQLLCAAKFKVDESLRNITVPTLVIRSSMDQFVSPENSNWIASKIKYAKLLDHTSAGHEIAYEHPEWLDQTIRNFCCI